DEGVQGVARRLEAIDVRVDELSGAEGLFAQPRRELFDRLIDEGVALAARREIARVVNVPFHLISKLVQRRARSRASSASRRLPSSSGGRRSSSSVNSASAARGFP